MKLPLQETANSEPYSFDAYYGGWHGDFLAAIARAVALADATNRELLRQRWRKVCAAYEAPDHTKAVEAVRQAAPHE